jgi:undecaprenyl-diphosphatase
MDEAAKRHRSIICMVSGIVLLLMVAIVGGGLADNADVAIRAAVHDWTSPGLTWLFETLSTIGSVATNFTMTVVVALMLFALGQRWSALHLVAVMGAAVIVSNLIKIFVARVRPEAFFGVSPDTYSFPSGHALFSGCFYGFFALFIASRLPQGWQRTTVIALAVVVVAGIGLSRVYLGVHYPSDIVSGFALAAMILCAAEGLFADLIRKPD